MAVLHTTFPIQTENPPGTIANYRGDLVEGRDLGILLALGMDELFPVPGDPDIAPIRVDGTHPAHYATIDR